MRRACSFLACLVTFGLLVLCGNTLEATAADIKNAVDMGLLPQSASALPPAMPVSRALWSAMLHEALGIWLPAGTPGAKCRDLARDSDGEICAKLAGAGWMEMPGARVFLPFGRMTGGESIRSLSAVARRIAGVKSGRGGTGPGTGPASRLAESLDSSHLRHDGVVLDLTQAAALLYRAVLSAPAPPGVDAPEAAVGVYLRNLAAAVETGHARPPLLPVCGAAAANLARNVQQLRNAAGGTPPVLRLLAVETLRAEITGLLATVTVRRRLVSGMSEDTIVESSVTDVFRLRLTPAGWLIFR